MQDICGGHVPQGLVIPPVVEEVHEVHDGVLQIRHDLVWYLVHLCLQSTVIPLQLPVGLGMVRRGQDVADQVTAIVR